MVTDVSDSFNEHRHALPTPNAHRFETDALVEALQPVEQSSHDSRPGHSKRMAKRYGSPMDIQSFLVDPDLVNHRENLRGERLIEFDKINVSDFHPGFLEDPRNRIDWTDPHVLGRDTGH
jgi:hypothetical protein